MEGQFFLSTVVGWRGGRGEAIPIGSSSSSSSSSAGGGGGGAGTDCGCLATITTVDVVIRIDIVARRIDYPDSH